MDEKWIRRTAVVLSFLLQPVGGCSRDWNRTARPPAAGPAEREKVAPLGLPPNYSVVVFGKGADGRHFVRLALYVLEGGPGATGGRARQDFYAWNSRQRTLFAQDATGEQLVPCSGPPADLDFGSDGIPIGCVDHDCSRNPTDWNRPLAVACRFWRGELSRAWGTWTTEPGKRISIRWDDGESELWKLTWVDRSAAALHKIELVQASGAHGPFVFDGRVRTKGENAGIGFGSTASLESAAADPISSHAKVFWGWVIGFNPHFQATSQGPSELGYLPVAQTLTYVGGRERTFRMATEDPPDSKARCPDGPDAFSYFSRPPSNPGLLNRRVYYQVSHDYDCDGYISEWPVHVTSGLQVLDGAGALRGYVFAEATWQDVPHPDHLQISAGWYLDQTGCQALAGVDPDQTEGCALGAR